MCLIIIIQKVRVKLHCFPVNHLMKMYANVVIDLDYDILL